MNRKNTRPTTPNQSYSQIPPARSGPRILPVAVVILYSLTLLIMTFFAGGRLYDWARTRIANTSPLANADLLAQTIRRTLPQSSDDAGQAVDGASNPGDQASAANAPAAPAIQPINILALGTDGRPDSSGPPLTDTMLLLSLDPASGTAGMLSLPRDLWVPIPSLDESAKINTAYMIGERRNYPGGGVQLTKDTVSGFVGQPVQYYVRVSFDGFVELIDLIGGVDVIVPATIHDEAYPTSDYGVETFHLDAGAQHLDGETALKYVRTRNTDSDYGRARRQQQVLRAVADKVMRADMIPTLIAKAPRLLYTMRSSIDTDIPMALALDLANYLRGASLHEIRQLVLDGRYGEETYSEDGQWILLPDRTRVRAALNTFFSPPAAGANGSVANADLSWVRVEVLNGTGEPGIAAQTRDMLQAQGWQVVSIGDADRSDYDHTLIVNYGIPEDMVDLLSTDLLLEANRSTLNGLNPTTPVDMRIVVGRDFLEKLP
ncbi:MAG: LCP family protein [Caldilineaceae bacterium]|nr:LCP family protein [Caldilineaceae bacterium]